MKKILLIILSIIVVAGISGGGVWYWQKGVFEKDLVAITQQTLDEEKQPISQNQEVKKDVYAGWGTYKDSAGRFEFKYPATISVVDPKTIKLSKDNKFTGWSEGEEVLFLVNKDIVTDFVDCYVKEVPACAIKNINGVANIKVLIKKKTDTSLVKMALSESNAQDIYNGNFFTLSAGNNIDYAGNDNYLNYVDYSYVGLGNNRTTIVDLDRGGSELAVVFYDSFMSSGDTMLNIAKSVKSLK